MIPMTIINLFKSKKLRNHWYDWWGLYISILSLIVFILTIWLFDIPMKVYTIVDKKTGTKYLNARDYNEGTIDGSGIGTWSCDRDRVIYNTENGGKLKVWVNHKEFILDDWELVDGKQIKEKDFCNYPNK